MHYSAHFDADDDASLIAWSFACPCCLQMPLVAEISPYVFPHRAVCTCRSCAHEWHLGLTARQALRLGFDSPAEVVVRWVV